MWVLEAVRKQRHFYYCYDRATDSQALIKEQPPHLEGSCSHPAQRDRKMESNSRGGLKTQMTQHFSQTARNLLHPHFKLNHMAHKYSTEIVDHLQQSAYICSWRRKCVWKRTRCRAHTPSLTIIYWRFLKTLSVCNELFLNIRLW